MLRDAQFAVRTLVRSPGFSAVVVLTLALGIGASTAIFSVVHAVVLRPLPYAQPEQLVRVTSELRGLGATDTGVSASELFDYQARTDLFTGVSGVIPISANVTSGNTPERVEMMLVSWNYFAVLGVSPALGRAFGSEDDTPGVGDVAVVSDAFWRRRLDADAAAIGRPIVIDADPVTVVGVMPRGFRHPGRTLQNEVEIWSPAGFRTPAAAPTGRSRRRLEGCLSRLQPGVTPEQAQARLVEYGAAASRQFPSEYPAQIGWRPRVIPLHTDLVGGVATPMFMLLSGVALLLLVSCVNVAHLVLARSSGRRQEMAIRQALGASGGRLSRQLVTESALLALCAAALGLLAASWGLRGLLALAPGRIWRIEDVRLDSTATLVAAAISLGVTVLFGLIPALHARRVATFAALKEGGRGRSTDGRAGRARDVLVAVEVGMATVLLICAGLLVRTVAGMLNVPVGFDTERLLTARMTLPRPNDPARAAYLDPARRVAFYRETLRRVQAIPGVGHAALSSQIPLGGFNPPLFVEIDGGGAIDPGVRPVMHDFQISPGYFQTMGVKIVGGRSVAGSDVAGSEPVVVVSEAAATRYWSGRNPIGGRVRLSPELPWMTVVGVASDVRTRRLTEQPQPIMYRPLEQSSDLSVALLVRLQGEPVSIAKDLAREVSAVDPDVPVHAVRTMTDLIGTAVSQRRFLMRLLVTFGVLATGLALLGIYGMLAYSVSQRTHEIGIRMAIGASQVDVSRMVMRRAMVLTTAGVIAGAATALGLSGLIRSQIFGIQPSDPATVGLVLTMMMAVAAAAAYLPARRAARIDPVVALRSQ
jgi:putative ABC transport system permease protein